MNITMTIFHFSLFTFSLFTFDLRSTSVATLQSSRKHGFALAAPSVHFFTQHKKRVARLTTNHPLAKKKKKKHSAKTTNNKT